MAAPSRGGLNRTSVGLKLHFPHPGGGWGEGLNRTSVGLKPTSGAFIMNCPPLPQSNQRGIETILVALIVRIRMCLNRTSVGLKQMPRSIKPEDIRRPQSNQRGIETNAEPHFSVVHFPGLNRTSVGLKLFGSGRTISLGRPGLNRTSVGLKPEQTNDLHPDPPQGLNRTSVGLKLGKLLF